MVRRSFNNQRMTGDFSIFRLSFSRSRNRNADHGGTEYYENQCRWWLKLKSTESGFSNRLLFSNGNGSTNLQSLFRFSLNKVHDGHELNQKHFEDHHKNQFKFGKMFDRSMVLSFPMSDCFDSDTKPFAMENGFHWPHHSMSSTPHRSQSATSRSVFAELSPWFDEDGSFMKGEHHWKLFRHRIIEFLISGSDRFSRCHLWCRNCIECHTSSTHFPIEVILHQRHISIRFFTPAQPFDIGFRGFTVSSICAM
jgi:hypothetical protein